MTLNPAYNRLQRDFRIASGLTLEAGSEYHYTRYGFNFTAASRRKRTDSVSYTGGTFFSGDRRDMSASLNLLPRSGVLATMTSQLSRATFPGARCPRGCSAPWSTPSSTPSCRSRTTSSTTRSAACSAGSSGIARLSGPETTFTSSGSTTGWIPETN